MEGIYYYILNNALYFHRSDMKFKCSVEVIEISGVDNLI